MSSLLDKLKTWVNAGLRGPRRYEREPGSPEGQTKEKAAVPEITDAPASRQELPEVTEAVQKGIGAARRPAEAVTTEQRSQVEQEAPAEQQTDAIEEDRIVDLLKDQTS